MRVRGFPLPGAEERFLGEGRGVATGSHRFSERLTFSYEQWVSHTPRRYAGICSIHYGDRRERDRSTLGRAIIEYEPAKRVDIGRFSKKGPFSLSRRDSVVF